MAHRIIREHRLDDLAACARARASRTPVVAMHLIGLLASNDPVIPDSERDRSVCAAISGATQERARDISAS